LLHPTLAPPSRLQRSNAVAMVSARGLRNQLVKETARKERRLERAARANAAAERAERAERRKGASGEGTGDGADEGGADAELLDTDWAAMWAEKLWSLVEGEVMSSRGGGSKHTEGSGSDEVAQRGLLRFYGHAYNANVEMEHLTGEVARAFAADKFATRCDEMACALICAHKRSDWRASTGRVPEVRVASLGGGPGNDACGFLAYNALHNVAERVAATVFDFSEAWEPLCKAIGGEAVMPLVAAELGCGAALDFARVDLRAAVDAEENQALVKDLALFDFFLFSYVCREAQACSHELLPEMLKRAKTGACFVFLDQFTGDIAEVVSLVERVQGSGCCAFEIIKLGGSREYGFNGVALRKLAPSLANDAPAGPEAAASGCPAEAIEESPDDRNVRRKCA